ncbi:exodeoxyribonuclease V subunit alpha [Nocardioides solisilvae]|uniref:exodeoxyribonuclease V subunit alpha n=1 Tax=Nocardioides solisilvae TaxID=1542435 RepID=UPI000D740370|nr:exodeoxyribonuclease V subunit alpha [Nocardioides solisilvae]
MTDVFEPLDTRDARLVLRSTGLLAAFNAAGVLTSGDVHVARTLGELGGEADETVLLAAALATRAVRSGSVCLDLAATLELAAEPPATPDPAPGVPPDSATAEPSATAPAPPAAPAAPPVPTAELPWPDAPAWADAIARSPLVALGVLRWERGLLYLDRYHEQESQVLRDLLTRAESAPPYDAGLVAASLERVLPGEESAEQRAACVRAVELWTSVVTGGPGTGKTTAVAGLLVALQDQAAARGERLRIALAAPTGKAAARLQQAVHDSATRFGPDDRAKLAGVQASTLHRLLRRDPGNSTRFRHHRGNRLPHDVVVVDEASMVSLTMTARLLEAVRPDARLVLVGDPFQLSSVDAGAVLSDLVRGFEGRPGSPVASLSTVHRYGAEIRELAEALRTGDADRVVEVLGAGHDRIEWVRDEDPSARIRESALGTALAVRDAAEAGDGPRALRALDRHRLLCAHRDGPWGVRHWNRRVEQWITAETQDPLFEAAYLGRPLLVTANDYSLGVHNGDTGVVVATPEGRRVVVDSGGGPRDFAPSRLGDVETMHAMTIHKSQGSQAEEVTVLLPPVESRLLTRELFYTAVTRAKERVRVVGSEAEVRAAVDRRAQRATGLADRLRDA